MATDDRGSTASTVSEVFKTVLQSPAPICMFYLSHPFGVVSPSVAKDAFKDGGSATPSSPFHDDQIVSGDNAPRQCGRRDGMQKRRRRTHVGDASVPVSREPDCAGNLECFNHALTPTSGPETDSRMRTGRLIPWPRDTWRREFILPPLIQFRGKQKDRTNAPDLEVILKTIRQAWNSPHITSNIPSRSYEDSDTPKTEWNIFQRNFGINYKQHEKIDRMKMGSGNNSTPVISGLLRRRYSVPEIIMRKHSLAQQKSYDESPAATAPSPHRSPAPVYYKSHSTSTPSRGYPLSSGSDSNLSLRRVERGEMSMRKSTLLRRIWSREMKRYDDARSGSWSPPMRRSQRRLHPEPVENHRCEECRKFEDEHSDESEELVVGASRKRLRLISSHGKEHVEETSYINTSSNCTRTASDNVPATTPNNNSLESTPTLSATETTSSNRRANNVHIYMTPIKSDESGSEPIDQGQDMLRVEIDLDNSEPNGNHAEQVQQVTTDSNRNESPETKSRISTTSNGDSPLDRFISKLLIDNLADLAEEINEQYENNNNLLRNTSTPKSKRTSSQYAPPDHMKIIVDKCDNFDLLSSSVTTASDNLCQSTESSNIERIIYFPSFSLECKDDMSSYASNYSDLELNGISGESLVEVNAGSTYAQNDQSGLLVVPRMLNKLPRTESLEAQHSLNSAVEEGLEVESNEDDTDDSVSLVDSLDELNVSYSNKASAEKTEGADEEPKTELKEDEESSSISVCREAEAFFVPMANNETNEPQTATVAETMPEKLKERIKRRQRELDKKRDVEHKRKQKEEEELMDPKQEDLNAPQEHLIGNKSESPAKLKPSASKKSEKSTKKQPGKFNSNHLRSEIGLLESYTIDSKGNMLMKAVNPKSDSTSAATTSVVNIPKKASKPTIQRKQSVIASKPPEIILPQPEKKLSSSTSTTKSKSRPRKDIQKMTIFQAQSDIITPDSENGPRRVYQKTEIQDGEKHIEILEIVECIETSPSSSPSRQQTYRMSAKSSFSRKSKIPIPIYKVGRSSGYQKALRCPMLRESSPNSVKCISRNLQSSSSNKVDRVIAELLIDALNRPEEVGIEIVKSPKDLSRDRSSSKKQNGQRRNTPRKSASNSKYQQMFEVIPEEKGSLSVDSSNDDTNKKSSKATTEDAMDRLKSTSELPSVSTAPTKEVSDSIIGSTSSSNTANQKSSSNSGRRAVDHAEPKAWIGFFRRHNDSSMDEDDSPSQSNPKSTSQTSCQPTISSPSTNTAAAGTTTPKEVSSADCINSAESDNVLKLIDETFHEKNDSKLETPTKSVSSLKFPAAIETVVTSIPVTANYPTTSETFTSTCKSCKLAKKRDSEANRLVKDKSKPTEKRKTLPLQPNKIKKSDTVLKIEMIPCSESSSQSSSMSSSTTAELSSSSRKKEKPVQQSGTGNVSQTNAWRVQSPDICKMAIPKRRDKPHYDEEFSTNVLLSEIDTKSFIVVEDKCNMSSSRLNSSANIPMTPPTSIESINPVLANKCTICCFCNPDLHKSAKTASALPCPYCNRRRTPTKREEETNTESDYFLNHPFYQSMTKSDHTHIRTRSRDSDVVSTKCTKVNEKIKNYNIPEGGGSQQETCSKSKATKSNLSRPKNIANLPPKSDTKAMHKTVHNTIKSKDSKTKNSSPDRRVFRLPSPYTNLSSTSFERTSSPSSSSDSTCPTTPQRCPVLPPARRQAFSNSRNNSKDKDKKKDSNSDGKIVGVSSNNNNNHNGTVPDSTNNNLATSNAKTNGQNNGWSVTVAGSYNQDMAPDVEMRLSFPKSSGGAAIMPLSQPAILAHQAINHITTDRRDIHHQRIINGNSIYSESHYQDEDLLNDNFARNNSHRPALPPPGNPKRTLTRIVSERTHSQRDINFPEVSPALRNNHTTRQMAKKAIKHTECRVAVASATRTISNFARGRRTISHHTLNTIESQRTNNNRNRHLIRDNSLDLGTLSSGRRMSFESQTPSATDCLELSIMGNAIAPEQKPRVLTMSEKDLTRRHQSCFTRNRAFFT